MADTGFKGPIVHAPATLQGTYAYRSKVGMMDSAEFTVFHDDFIGTSPSNAPADYTWTAIIDTGATLTNNASLVKKGGIIGITSDGASEGVSIYHPRTVKLESGKRFFMEVSCMTLDADDTDVQFGLSDLSATTDPEDMWDTSNADGVACGVLDGSAAIKLVYDKDNGGPVTETSTLVLSDSTWTTLAFGWDGVSLKFYKNGLFAGQALTTGQVPDDVLLAPFVGARTGGDAAHVVYFDYVRWALER